MQTVDKDLINEDPAEYARQLEEQGRKQVLNKLSNRVVATAVNGGSTTTYVGEKADEDETHIQLKSSASPEGDSTTVQLLKNMYSVTPADGNAYKVWSIYPRFWEQVLDNSTISAGDGLKVVYYLGGTVKVVEGTVVDVDSPNGDIGSIRLKGGDYDEITPMSFPNVSVYIYRQRDKVENNPNEKIVMM